MLITGTLVGKLVYASACQSGTDSSTNELVTQSASISVYLVFESVSLSVQCCLFVDWLMDLTLSVCLSVCLHEIYRFNLYNYFFASFSIKPLNNQIINQSQSVSYPHLSLKHLI